jgi:integrase
MINALMNTMTERGLSAATRKLTFAVLGKALGDAYREGSITSNPVRRARAPRSAAVRRVGAFSERELRALLAHTQGTRLHALWRLTMATGLRRGELLGLRWQDLDVDAARLRVVQQLVPTKGGATFGAPKSRRGTRTVALDGETVTALRQHRETQILERDLAGDAYAIMISCSPTRSGGPSGRSASPTDSVGSAPASRTAACTRCATPPSRSRCRTASRCTSWPRVRATPGDRPGDLPAPVAYVGRAGGPGDRRGALRRFVSNP